MGESDNEIVYAEIDMHPDTPEFRNQSVIYCYTKKQIGRLEI